MKNIYKCQMKKDQEFSMRITDKKDGKVYL